MPILGDEDRVPGMGSVVLGDEHRESIEIILARLGLEGFTLLHKLDESEVVALRQNIDTLRELTKPKVAPPPGVDTSDIDIDS